MLHESVDFFIIVCDKNPNRCDKIPNRSCKLDQKFTQNCMYGHLKQSNIASLSIIDVFCKPVKADIIYYSGHTNLSALHHEEAKVSRKDCHTHSLDTIASIKFGWTIPSDPSKMTE